MNLSRWTKVDDPNILIMYIKMSESDYDYFGISAMREPDPSIMTLYRQDNYLAVRVYVPPAATNTTDGIHLGLLIDVSDSMSDGRLKAVKRTLYAARNLFRENDYVTLVVFGETGQLIVANHCMNEAGKTEFYSALDAIQTGGCTNMSAGLEILNTVQKPKNPYDSVIVLTDGEVNRGIESTEGLSAMALSIGNKRGLTFNMLGYGADHNRTLLRVLSTQTCGVYQYIQSDEQVSSSFGDIIGNARAVVFRGVSIYPSEGWNHIEVSPKIGDIVPGREIWSVYQKVGDTNIPPSVRIQGWDKNDTPTYIIKNTLSTANSANITVQILRARVSCALAELSNILESRRVIRRRTAVERIDTARGNLESLQNELNRIPQYSELWFHPLILHMKAQIVEALSPIDSDEMEISLARLSSGAAALSTQRAVSDPCNVDTGLFTSPAGRDSSCRVHERYHR
jgi:hypothetical protein